MKRLAGGNSNIFLCSSLFGGRWTQFDLHIFQLGWFNHQYREVRKILELQKLIWHLCFLLVCAIAIVAVIPNFNLMKRLHFLLVNIFDWNSTGSGEILTTHVISLNQLWQIFQPFCLGVCDSYLDSRNATLYVFWHGSEIAEWAGLFFLPACINPPQCWLMRGCPFFIVEKLWHKIHWFGWKRSL